MTNETALLKRIERMEAMLLRVRQGYRNILEVRKLSSGRYGALTREEIEAEITEIDKTLAGDR